MGNTIMIQTAFRILLSVTIAKRLKVYDLKKKSRNFKGIKLRKPLFYFIIMFEYIIGLICIAHIGNYINTK
jgi:hypothetical protein